MAPGGRGQRRTPGEGTRATSAASRANAGGGGSAAPQNKKSAASSQANKAAAKEGRAEDAPNGGVLVSKKAAAAVAAASTAVAEQAAAGERAEEASAAVSEEAQRRQKRAARFSEAAQDGADPLSVATASNTVKAVAITSVLPEAERRLQRRERFGVAEPEMQASTDTEPANPAKRDAQQAVLEEGNSKRQKKSLLSRALGAALTPHSHLLISETEGSGHFGGTTWPSPCACLASSHRRCCTHAHPAFLPFTTLTTPFASRSG